MFDFLNNNTEDESKNRYYEFGDRAIKAFGKTARNKNWFNNSNSINANSANSSWASNVPWAAIGSAAKSGYNAISGHDDNDYSDLEESIIYPLQGASVGASFGPIGAAIGAGYGLGYSFKDDMGLKDSNFLTQLLYPIGMGDGGGLRIDGKSIFDLG